MLGTQAHTVPHQSQHGMFANGWKPGVAGRDINVAQTSSNLWLGKYGLWGSVIRNQTI